MTSSSDTRSPSTWRRCVQTPAARFAALPDFAYPPAFTEVGGGVRMAHVEAGSRTGPPVVLLHGEPTWGFSYRHMIGPLAAAGYRVLVPDLIGFGRSDKPLSISDHSYRGHVDWKRAWFDALGLADVVLFGQHWGRDRLAPGGRTAPAFRPYFPGQRVSTDRR